MAAALQFDRIPRRVLYAVELVDPVSGARVSEGLGLQPLDAAGRVLAGGGPVRNRSGRFVWLQPGTAWPARIAVSPERGAPYLARIQDVPAPAGDPFAEDTEPNAVSPSDRLVRIVLSPSRNHPLEGVTAMRGAVLEAAPRSAPVAGAIVQLRWYDGQDWHPGTVDPSAPRRSVEVITDADGEFAAFLSGHDPIADPVGDEGLVQVRLEVTRRQGGAWRTRRTDETQDDPAQRGGLPKGGLIRAGTLYPPFATVSWDRLKEI